MWLLTVAWMKPLGTYLLAIPLGDEPGIQPDYLWNPERWMCGRRTPPIQGATLEQLDRMEREGFRLPHPVQLELPFM